MTYSVAVSSSGQITLPSAIRKRLGIDKRVTIIEKGDQAIVTRERTLEEALEEAHQRLLDYEKDHPEVAARRKKYSGMTAHEMLDAWMSSPEGKAEMLRDA